MVEALAKARYPAGVSLEYGRDPQADFDRTLELLQQAEVTLFEATLLWGRRLARVDILEKRGNVVRLIEVKAKSFDGAEHQLLLDDAAGCFRTKKGSIRSEWREKLEDITYQVLLLDKVLPGVTIKPVLALMDKSKRTSLDQAPRLFELVHQDRPDGTRRLHTGRYIGTAEDLAQLDLVTEVDVSEEVDLLREEVEAAAARYESRLDKPLAVHLEDVHLDAACRKCEFNAPAEPEDGFRQCWGTYADTRPHMLELYKVGSAKAPDRSNLVPWMLQHRKSSLLEIPEEGLVRADGSIGADAERQLRQISYTRDDSIYLGPNLRTLIEGLEGPIHFIDFETSRIAIPYHAGMRPYGLVTFQWSVHTVDGLGIEPRHQEWLNNSDLWPNQLFAESLRAAIGNSGPVLTWSHYEASVLKEIVRDLAQFGRDVPQLVEWLEDVFENRIRDMHRWCTAEFYHPGMRGSASIKAVLDALWRADEHMRRQFEAWTGLAGDPDQDPYSALPPVRIHGVLQDIHEGTGAMRGYQEMMYGESSRDLTAREGWSKLLRQYCKLDTLSMVLIMEYWRRTAATFVSR